MTVPTGFHPLDDVLSGGARAGEFVVVGGRAGVGKTVATLQWARSAAMSGFAAIYVSYEHDEQDLLDRLLRLEVGTQDVDAEPGAERSPAALERAIARLRSYAQRLLFVRASASLTDVASVERVVRAHRGEGAIAFVDSLQKLAADGNGPGDVAGMWQVTGGLKEIALSHQVPVVATSSTSRSGLVTPRVRIHHLMGAEAISDEADIVLLLNDKVTAVSHAHRAFDSVRAAGFVGQVVVSVEKNRRGESRVDLELVKDFTHFRFDPRGSFTADRLYDESLGIT